MIVRLTCCLLLVTVASMLSAGDRVAWTSSRVVGSPDPPKPFHVARLYPELQFDRPVELMPLADTGRMMLLEVTGKLYTFIDDPEIEAADLAIDLKPLIDNFTQSYGFAVHPDFANNRQIFVAYAGGPKPRADGTRLSRFVVSDESPPTIDPASEEILLTWPSGGHNGCAIRFDSEGMLYFSTGDGARPYPPDEYDVSQDLSDLRSTICRIDIDHRDKDLPYRIPPDNPFIDTPDARPEIWAYGFRNPWRFTIDPEDDRMLVGDVGWELWELVFDVKRSGNYGWSIYEGPQPIRADIAPGPTPIEKPLVAYPHTVGQSVTGGVVYRGEQFNELRGAYLYGDYVTGLLWGWKDDTGGVAWNPVIAETGLKIITISTSRNGELLIVDYDGGIYELIENPIQDQPHPFPQKLSETGLFDSTETLEPAEGVVRYDVIAESHRGDVTTEFVFGIPDNGTVKISQRQRNWQYPTGTVFANTISTAGTSDGQPPLRLETQLLHFDGMTWQPYSFVWNQQQTDAELVPEQGVNASFPSRGVEWTIESRAQCRACHSRQNGGAIGFCFENLPTSVADRFIAQGIIDRAAPKQWNVRTMVDPSDDSADLTDRARSYLAANCAHCHRRGGGGTVPLDLVTSVPTEEINAVDVAPTQGSFEIESAKVVFPGNPYQSVLYYRLATSGAGRMPKLWMRDNDRAGLRLIHDWIASMDPDRFEQVQSRHAATFDAAHTTDALRRFARLIDSTPDQAKTEAMTIVSHSQSPLIAGIFERFLPPEQRRKRLGPNINPEQILALRGDPDQGRTWFFESQLGQCVLCHRVQGSGQSVGPDLDAIASKRTREQLLESIIDPSKTIEPAFQSYAVLTDDGAIVTGLKIDESDSHWTLRPADGKDRRIEKESIELIRPQEQSLMPTGIAAEMTAEELANLLAFLESLK